MIEPSGDKYTRYLAIVEKINIAIETVTEANSLHSGHRRIHEHAEFKKLVEMGDRLIPYLFHRITHHGCNWTILLLLSQLVPESPILPEHRGAFYHMIHDWLGWYLQSEHRARDDIYHGLVEYDVSTEH